MTTMEALWRIAGKEVRARRDKGTGSNPSTAAQVKKAAGSSRWREVGFFTYITPTPATVRLPLMKPKFLG